MNYILKTKKAFWASANFKILLLLSILFGTGCLGIGEDDPVLSNFRLDVVRTSLSFN